MAAEAGSVEGWVYLGRCHYKGEGVKRDFDEAMKCFQKAGALDAAKTLALLREVLPEFCDGGAAPQKPAKAEQPSVAAQMFVQQAVDYGKAAEASAALQGSTELMLRQGNQHARGADAGQRALGVKWYRAAAERGNIEAQIQLGQCYYKGVGVAVDVDQARQWFLRAIEADKDGWTAWERILKVCPDIQPPLYYGLMWTAHRKKWGDAAVTPPTQQQVTGTTGNKR
jgi:TPR repeat protein